MKNIINYYYNLNVLNVYIINNNYYFNYNNKDYFLVEFDRPLNDINTINNIYSELKKRNIITNSFVINKDNQIITFINNIPYILIRDNIINRKISLNDILYIQNNTINLFNNSKNKIKEWIKLWQIKIDNYEEQISLNSNKYSILKNTIDYYIALGENAITYLINTNVNNISNNISLAHKRINNKTNTFDFYNPTNYILDSRVRDFCEYIKNIFFFDNINIDIFKHYLDYMNFTRDEYILLVARLLFPTYYFDVYDSIMCNNCDEQIIYLVINKTSDYIFFLKQVFMYIIYQKGINIPYIEWILKDAN